MDITVQVGNGRAKVVGVTALGCAYGPGGLQRSRLAPQEDGSYAGTERGLEPAPVGYRGYRRPVAISAEELAPYVERALAQGPGYHTFRRGE